MCTSIWHESITIWSSEEIQNRVVRSSLVKNTLFLHLNQEVDSKLVEKEGILKSWVDMGWYYDSADPCFFHRQEK